MNAAFITLPQCEIFDIEKTETAIKLSGVLKNVASLSRAMTGWVVMICVPENKFIRGKLNELNSDNFQVSVEVSNLEFQDYFSVGDIYPLLDGYWGDLAKLVFDDSLIWQKVKFEAQDSIVYHPDGTVETVQGGWDHEHCRICLQNISNFEAANHYGYVNQDADWLCESCYQKYVTNKSLGFINLDQVF
jgi:hypothetical protein